MVDTMTENIRPLSETIPSDVTSTPSDTPLSSQEVCDVVTLKDIEQAVFAPPKRSDTTDTINSNISVDSKATSITVPDETPANEETMEKETAHPTLERSSSYFDIPKAGERPAPRRYQSMLCRNSMANPGASHWEPRK